MYLPFENVRYFSHLFWDLDQKEKDDFTSQVAAYFSSEGQEDEYGSEEVILKMVQLKLKNSKYLVATTEQEEKKYQLLLIEMLEILDFMVEHWSATKLLHAYLVLVTIILNEPELAKQNKKTIQKILDKLL